MAESMEGIVAAEQPAAGGQDKIITGMSKLDNISVMLQPKPKSLTFRGSPGQLVYLTICSMVPRFPAYALRCFRRWA